MLPNDYPAAALRNAQRLLLLLAPFLVAAALTVSATCPLPVARHTSFRRGRQRLDAARSHAEREFSVQGYDAARRGSAHRDATLQYASTPCSAAPRGPAASSSAGGPLGALGALPAAARGVRAVRGRYLAVLRGLRGLPGV